MIDLERGADILKVAGEPTRLRILFVLSRSDLTVTDLTFILNQSQPRVSRHLKLMFEARLITRYQEGSWAYFRLSETGDARAIVDAVLVRISAKDPDVERDLDRLDRVRRSRRERAETYFARNAAEWDALRLLHGDDAETERHLLAAIGSKRIETMLDLGTGTGRMLELFAPHYARGVGIDLSREMLAIARAKLDDAGIAHASVRQGDVMAPPVDRNAFDLVVVHKVLHYLDDPAALIAEAARALRPEGILLVVDYQTHGLEKLRDEHAHTRLGFSDQQMRSFAEDAGLEMRAVRSIEPSAQDSLVTKIWVLKDQRLLIAEPAGNENQMDLSTRGRIAT